MGSFDTLLDLQDTDTLLTQLRHRRSHLSEQEQLNEVERRLSKLASDLSPTLKIQQGFETRQRDLESQIHEIDNKLDSASKQLYGGTVTSSRELQALEADIASLKRHRSELEDTELELLMEREPIDAVVVAGAGERDRLDHEAAGSRVAIAEAVVLIDSEVVAVTSRRQVLREQIDPDLLGTYERIRTKNSGVGVARLEHGTCMSCRLKISAVQIDAFKKLADKELAICDQCGAILAR